MMPGLIDAHWHAIFAALPVAALLTAPRSPGGPVSHVERTGAANIVNQRVRVTP